jgi:hypothetical protein
MYSVPPSELKATPVGPDSSAEVAVPSGPSPLDPAHTPATVVMLVPAALTRRTQWLPVTAINSSPAELRARPLGLVRVAEVGGPLSPVSPAQTRIAGGTQKQLG